jgi:hypothetical protein
MSRYVRLCALFGLLGLFGPSRARAQSPGTQSAAAIWVASQAGASLRVGRGVVQAQVERAAALLLPYEHDPRFKLLGSSIRHLPHKNLIEIRSDGVVVVPFVQDKRVSVVARIRPVIRAGSLELSLVGTRRSVSSCELDGPICFMVKRAIDRHLGDGAKLQAFLDTGLNTALRSVFRAAAEVPCGEGRVSPTRVKTAPEFLEVLMAASAADLACLRRARALLVDDLSAELKRDGSRWRARDRRSAL